MRTFHNHRVPLPKDPTTLPQTCAVGLLVFISAVAFGGCKSSWPVDGQAPLLDNDQFMGAWTTYLHCRASVELDEIQVDLQRLTRVPRAVTGERQISVHLPAAIRSLITRLSPRLAVNPQSMAVACALHGGHIALSAGRRQLAHELFTAVVASEEFGGQSYYVAEARRRLKHLEERLMSNTSGETVVQASSR